MTDRAIQQITDARAKLRTQYGENLPQLMVWMIVIHSEWESAQQSLRQALVEQDGALDECEAALTRLGAAAVEALVVLNDLERLAAGAGPPDPPADTGSAAPRPEMSEG